jgi:hypothetical protein
MNTNALKRFAKDARIKLLDQVGRKLEFVLTQDTAELRGKQKEIDQLRKKVAEQGEEQLKESVAYTWFNRLMALRFMDANGYTIPKVVTPLPGMSNPEILQNALAGNIEPDLSLDHQRLNDLLDGKTAATDAQTQAYKMLLVAACNQWHSAMPFMFERISDYTELLLPDDLLSEFSIVTDIRKGMTDEDCQQEELIGWLYQFYIADKKDDVFEALKKNIKITAENIPAATQLFTPRWIVRYMVENTLGKLWLTLRPNSNLRQHMPYFIEAPEGNEPSPLPEGLNGVTDITFLDPCQGSGHVLVYAFDLFTKIYEEEGYNTNEIPALILQHNLFGIDIDERAAQLAAFALTMKARSYYARFLRKAEAPTVFALKNCGFTPNEVNQLCAKGLKPVYEKLHLNNLEKDSSGLLKYLKLLAKKEKTELPETIHEDLLQVLEQFDNEAYLLSWIESHQEKPKSLKIKETLETGTLDKWVWNYAYSEFAHLRYKVSLYNQLENIGSLYLPDHSVVGLLKQQKAVLNQNSVFESTFISKLEIGINQAHFLSRHFHCVVTNPPYLGGGGMNESIKTFVEKYYPISKSDLMACFMERCLALNPKSGKTAMINQHSWMFLSSYADLRPYFIDHAQFENMLHLGPHTFPEIGGEVVQNTAFVIGNYALKNRCVFIRLTEFENSKLKEEKTLDAIRNQHCDWYYEINPKEFEKIPGSPIGYWVGPKGIDSFSKFQILASKCEVRTGLDTGNNELFVRHWSEVSIKKSAIRGLFNEMKWVPYNNGGGYRKWYGNNNLLVNWENDGKAIHEFNNVPIDYNGAPVRAKRFYFKKGITFGKISGKGFTTRLCDSGFIFSSGGSMIFPESDEKYLLGYTTSKVAQFYLNVFNPTLNNQVGDILRLPISNGNSEKVIDNVNKCLELSKEEWDSRENSWDFQQNEIIKQCNFLLSKSFESYNIFWSNKFNELHKTEEELNRYFIDEYELQNELNPNVSYSEVSFLQEEAKIINEELYIDNIAVLLQLLSYSIGCLLGRYSLDKPGLIIANQGETLQDFSNQISSPTFVPDEDNIIPVLEGEWFTDDIVGRFKEFLRAAFGVEHFEENLKYIEDTLGKDIRKYFVKDFYNDHIKRYKKRPIYWMFSSPKGHFKALIYMHRYQPDLCSKMLNDYLQAFISKLEAAKQTQTMLSLREDISAREKTLAIKEVDDFELILRDCRAYEKTLFTIATQKISIDLDDGVKVNYQKFKDVLVPIKGLEKEEE